MSPHLVWTINFQKLEGRERWGTGRCTDLKSACCRLGKQPGEESKRTREREGVNYKSRRGLHPSTPPKHPQAEPSALLQLHVWGGILYVFPSFIPFFLKCKEAKDGIRSGWSSWSKLKDNPHQWVVHHSAVRGSEWQILSSLSGGRKEWDEQRNKWGGREERSGEETRAPVEFHRQVSTMAVCVCAQHSNVHEWLYRN